MKATSSRQPASVASAILKLVGVILIVSSLLDYAILLIPPSRLNNPNAEQAQLNFLQWQQTVTSQLIDRGVIPMVGLAFLFAAFWIDTNSTDGRKSWQELLKPGALLLSVLLGLTFLLPVPLLNFNSLRLLNTQANKQINQRSEVLETQLKNRSQQVSALAQDDQQLTRLDQAITTAQGDQLAQLQQLKELLQRYKQDPKQLNQQVEEIQTRIRSEKQQAQKQAREEFIKSLARSITSSLLLAIGYISIGLLALRGLGGMKASRRQA